MKGAEGWGGELVDTRSQELNPGTEDGTPDPFMNDLRSRFFVNLLDHLEDVLGERAAAGLVQYAAAEAAAEEVRAWGSRSGAPQDAASTAWLRDGLGLELDLVENRPGLTVVDVPEPAKGPDRARVARSLLVGILKGAHLKGSRSRSVELVVTENRDGGLRVELRGQDA